VIDGRIGKRNQLVVFRRAVVISSFRRSFVLSDIAKASILPQFFPADWLESIPIVYSNFPSRIRIGYVLREQGGYYWYLLKDDFDSLAISLSELHSFALENLIALPSGRVTLAEMPGGAEGFIAADDNFAAARILLPEVRKRLAAKLGEEFLFTLPHRDDCFCWSLSQPAERQMKHAAKALEDFLSDDYRLTPDILSATPDGFSLHKTQEPA
jgi:hypothetical protein